MPWRGAEEPGEFPTLGYLVADWIEELCVVPDGPVIGSRFILTDEMLRFLLWHYRIREDVEAPDRHKPSTPFVYRRSQLVRPQKWGKSPFSAAIVCAEAEGPVLFDGWDANGEPVGRPWDTPHIQITAVSGDQTANVWRALQPMIELGPLADIIPDTGYTRINLKSGGLIEPVTAEGRSRLGQRLTCALQDETHSWLKVGGGHRLAQTQRRNLAGMGGRSIETTNAWDPSEQSIAQLTDESPAKDIYQDYPTPPKGRMTHKRERIKVLRAVYGDSARNGRGWKGWVDLDRIDAEIEELLPIDPGQAERFFLNRSAEGESVAFDLDTWSALAHYQDPYVRPQGSRAKRAITIGFDGARFDDSTGIVCTDLLSGYQWVAGLWEHPDVWTETYPWEVPESEVEQTVDEIHQQFRVVRAYGDPPYWESQMAAWSGRWPKVWFSWWTNRLKPMAYALHAYTGAMAAGELSHAGDPDLDRHIANARRLQINVRDDKGRRMWVIQKERPKSPKKIDLAVAGCLSWEARRDAIAAGALEVKTHTAAGFGGRRRRR